MNMNSQNQRNRNNRGGNRNQNGAQNVSIVDLIKENAAIILSPEEDREGTVLFSYAEQAGRKFCEDRVTISQIRKIFSEVKKLKYDEAGEYKYSLRILKAQIGYTAGRFTNNLRNFKDIFNILIDQTLRGGEAELKRFKDFFEAVVAYHRAYGGS